MKSQIHPKLLALAIVTFFALGGCSTGAAPTGAVSVSEEDMKAGTIHVAKTYLDEMEQAPPQSRQLMVSKNPHIADALKKAVAIDPATKSRVDSMQLKLP